MLASRSKGWIYQKILRLRVIRSTIIKDNFGSFDTWNVKNIPSLFAPLYILNPPHHLCHNTKSKYTSSSALLKPKYHLTDLSNVPQGFQVIVAQRRLVLDTSNHSNQHYNLHPDPHFARIRIPTGFTQSFSGTLSNQV